MIECTKKSTCLLFASLAVNLFMFGFIAGKIPFGHHHPHPGFEKRFDRDDRGPGPREFGRRGHDGPPPPPFMGGGLFSKEELKADKPFIDERLGKVQELRKDFAEQLKKGPLTAEQIQAHFKAVDDQMDGLRDRLHKKMIDKLTTMSPEEREKFAERSLKFEERAEFRKAKREERRAKFRAERKGHEAREERDAPPPPADDEKPQPDED